ncbi:CPN20 [Scenedesmus sp. PABB004]|nr:CPN20 [Scenedesmus sp. PABB004]
MLPPRHPARMDALNTLAAEMQAAMADEAVLDHRLRHTRSFNDVQAVDAGHAGVIPPLQKIRKTNLSEQLFAGSLKAVQEDENEVAEVVIVCEPEGATLTMGGLHPRGSLYERPVNIDSAKAQHAAFREVLRAHGVRVLTVREILAFGVEERMGARVELEELAADTLTYRIADGHDPADLSEGDRFYLSDDYKRSVVSAMSTSQLIEICLINPTVTLLPSFRDTGLTASYTFEPLSNLVYTRDQQITTCRGIVMGRLRSQQRQKEVELMSYCFNKLGLPVAGRIVEPGFLEGGDFFPMGQDLALVGVGLRSNVEACEQLMARDLLGTRRLGVVRDDFDRDQDRMHLDCVFSVLGERCCIMLETIMGADSPTRRLVDEYVRDPATKKYSLAREGVEFAEFVRGEGFSIIPIKHEHQLAYACNVLNLGKGRIISVHAPSAREIVKHEAFTGDVQVIDFSSVTSIGVTVRAAVAVPQQFSAVKPVGDRVLVKVDKEEAKSVGGVLLPVASQTKQTAGSIVAAGDVGSVKAGDRVVYSKYAGTEMELAGEDHVLIKEEDVIGLMPAGDKIAALKPLGDRVLIKCAEKEKTTAGGVLLASDSGDKPNFGTVVAVGAGKKAEEGKPAEAPNVAVGATVMYSKYSGTEFEEDDESFIVVRESDILAALS